MRFGPDVQPAPLALDSRQVGDVFTVTVAVTGADDSLQQNYHSEPVGYSAYLY